MPRKNDAKGTKLTLKMAKKAIRKTPEGWRRLTLSNMGITIFPKCLLKLTDVDELDLSRNLIQKLPDNIGNFSSLRWLDLHSNKLESVPESIGCLVRLTHLNLSNNHITSAGLPSTLGFLTSLKCLNLGMNQLDTLPPTIGALENLQELGLFDNLFMKLPEFLTILRNLTKVNTKRNPLLYAEGVDRRLMNEKPEPAEDVYLVHESSLCRTCSNRFKNEREKLTRGEDMLECKMIRTYPGLMVPNSVAIINQDVWRIRKVETGQSNAADIT